jgi:hypothetical protein
MGRCRSSAIRGRRVEPPNRFDSSRAQQRESDRLPACEHLACWTDRSARYGAHLGQELAQRGVVAELTASNCVTHWAYAHTEAASGLTWVQADLMMPLEAEWRRLVAT